MDGDFSLVILIRERKLPVSKCLGACGTACKSNISNEHNIIERTSLRDKCSVP